MRKQLISAILTFVPATAAMAADIDLYGQINKTIMHFDDGLHRDTAILDNDSSSTRFGLRGQKQLSSRLTGSFLLEVQVQSGDSGGVTQAATGRRVGDAAAGSMRERHSRVGLAGDWGALFLGRTSTATDTIMEKDLAQAADVSGTGSNYFGGGLQVNVNGAPSGLFVDDFMDNFDGARANSLSDRMSTVRYDSPLYKGLQGRVAAGQGGVWDAALLYNQKYAQTTVYGALGYVKFATSSLGGHESLNDQWAGIVSAKHSSGFGATAAYGLRDGTGSQNASGNARFGYIKAGYGWQAYGLAAEYGSHTGASSHTNGEGNDAEVFGIAGQMELGQGVSTAAYWKTFRFDVAGAENIDVMGLNLRVKF
jgi:predicted porin